MGGETGGLTGGGDTGVGGGGGTHMFVNRSHVVQVSFGFSRLIQSVSFKHGLPQSDGGTQTPMSISHVVQLFPIPPRQSVLLAQGTPHSEGGTHVPLNPHTVQLEPPLRQSVLLLHICPHSGGVTGGLTGGATGGGTAGGSAGVVGTHRQWSSEQTTNSSTPHRCMMTHREKTHFLQTDRDWGQSESVAHVDPVSGKQCVPGKSVVTSRHTLPDVHTSDVAHVPLLQ